MARTESVDVAHTLKKPKQHPFPLHLVWAVVGMLLLMASPAIAEGQDGHQKALEALGGRSTIQAITRIEVRATGVNYEPMENVVVETPIHTSDDTVTMVWEPGTDRFRRETALHTIFPFKGSWEFKEIFDGSAGALTGRVGIRPSADNQLPPSRLGANLKEFWLLNPQFLLANATLARGAQSLPGSRSRDLALTLPDAQTEWTVRLDRETMLPATVSVSEHDPVFGLVDVTATFSDWRDVAGIKTPFRVTKRVDGVLVRQEIRQTVAYHTSAKSTEFNLPTDAAGGQPDEALVQWGWGMSHWFLRRVAMAAPADADQSRPVEFIEVADGVFQVTGSSHHNLVIVGPDSLVVVDAPLYDRRSHSVLQALADRWPDRPVRQLILTHHHNDHIGGLQPYIVAGAQLVVPARDHAFFAAVVRRTLGITADILPVADHARLAGFQREISVRAVPNSHANDLLVVHLPKEELLFVTDLFSPGRETQNPLLASELLNAIRFQGLAVSQLVGGHGRGTEPLSALEAAAGQ